MAVPKTLSLTGPELQIVESVIRNQLITLNANRWGLDIDTLDTKAECGLDITTTLTASGLRIEVVKR
jgi:hypothetical protein